MFPITEAIRICRVTSAGVLDTTFSSDGCDTRVQSRYGRIVLADDGGATVIAEDLVTQSGIVRKYDTLGELDVLFDGDGELSFVDGGGGNSILSTYNSYLYTIGSVVGAQSPGQELRRLDMQGVSDSDFGGGSPVTYDGGLINYRTCMVGEYFAFGNIYTACVANDGSDLNFVVVSRYTHSFQIEGLPANLTAEDSFGNSVEDGSGYGLVGDTFTNVKADGNWLVSVNAQFSEDLDWSLVSGDVDLTERKCVVAGLDEGQDEHAEGVYGPHILFVPRVENDDTVRICPDAVTLADVTRTCANGVDMHEGDVGVNVTEMSGQLYWMIGGVAGTGGISWGPELQETGAYLVLPILFGVVAVALPVGVALKKRG